MAKEKKETGVAVANQFTLGDVPNLLEKVNAEIKKLKGDKERAAKITEPLGPCGKISDMKDKMALRSAYSYISKKGESVNTFNDVFAEVEGVGAVDTYKEGGFTVKQWQDEILAQYREITFEAKLAKLEVAKKLLTDNLSAEQKFSASIADIAELFA